MAMDPERTAGGRDPWIDRLSEYLDGEITGRERQALEEHLRSCGGCSTVLVDLRAVVERAHALEDVAPAEDLWPPIAQQIAQPMAGAESRAVLGSESAAPARARVRPLHGQDRQGWWARRIDLSMPQLAAAGVLLVALSAGGVWLSLRPLAPAPVPAPRPVARNQVGPAPAPAADGPVARTVRESDAGTAPALAAMSNPRYDAAVAELEQALAEGRGRLDPRTLQVVEQNLKIIDRAIDEARRAVAADPGNLWLRSHLAATMMRKVDLLRSATQVASVQG
jgi:putative zinc finger protein